MGRLENKMDIFPTPNQKSIIAFASSLTSLFFFFVLYFFLILNSSEPNQPHQRISFLLLNTCHVTLVYFLSLFIFLFYLFFSFVKFSVKNKNKNTDGLLFFTGSLELLFCLKMLLTRCGHSDIRPYSDLCSNKV